MNPANRAILTFWLNALKIFDIVSLILSFILAILLAAVRNGYPSLTDVLSMKVKLWNSLIFVALLTVWHIIFRAGGLYNSKRLSSTILESRDVVRCVSFTLITMIAIARLLQLRMVTTSFLFIFCVLSLLFLVGGRLFLRFVLAHQRRSGRNVHHILLVGTNSRAIQFARRIEGRPDFGYRIVGFVDDQWSGSDHFAQSGYRLCCNFATLPDFLRNNVVDEAAFFMPLQSFYELTACIAALFEQHGIMMRFDSHIYNFANATSSTDEFDGDAHITAYFGRSDGWSLITKRVIDIACSALLLVLLFPVFFVISLLIFFTSGGPILFSQKRVGLNKRHFTMYKFRTMVANAEAMQNDLLLLNEMTGPVFKMRKDPRITPLGRILRKTSLDELPQLFNVLLGDMSLVGPRAMALRDYNLFSEDWQRRRFSVRPGITCLWQVRGRNSIPFEQWMEMDMEYIDHWSLWLDLKILMRTIPAVVRGAGAA